MIIGIAGGTGSGKTTLVTKIAEKLSQDEVLVISQDSYYKDNAHLSYEERCEINFDHPNALDFELLYEHLKALKKGQSIEQPVYSFIEHTRMKETLTISPKKVILLEGILVLANTEVRSLMDAKIFVDADSDERLIRRLKRDVADRGRTVEEVLDRYQNTMKPMHEAFIEPSKSHADLIIPHNEHNPTAVLLFEKIIMQLID
ncbi:MAG: uridine kinase [Flavobacteriaceae bacterium]|nr:uridine kinase [Flavobacteriaceae bacterium]MDG2315132.1 uridine kinase [Flavobacteriaceae bacterium]